MVLTIETSADPWLEPAGRFDLGEQVFTTVMVTGHRPQYLTAAEAAWSQVMLHHTAWRLRSVYGTQVAVSGMALGADTWWALAALASGMHLHAYIPFEDQPRGWSEGDVAMWNELRRKAKRTVIVDERRDMERKDVIRALHARNDAMLKATAETNGLVVALYKDGESGGTASAVRKASAQGRPLLVLDPATRKIERRGW